jgi:hypothetical protein
MRSPNATFSRMVLGNGFGRWNTMPTRRRSSTTSVVGAETSSPETSMRPCVRTLGMRSFMRLNERSSVLLPQPEGPMMAVTLPLGIPSDTPLRA